MMGHPRSPWGLSDAARRLELEHQRKHLAIVVAAWIVGLVTGLLVASLPGAW